MPVELELSHALDRWGAPAVLGRLLYVREMHRISVTEKIVQAYQAKQVALNAVDWANENPELDKLLLEAIAEQKLCQHK